MPGNTNNDAPDADRPTARSGQEGPAKAGDSRPPGEIAAEREAEAAVREKAGATGKPADTGA
jgi:hypothetical protein